MRSRVRALWRRAARRFPSCLKPNSFSTSSVCWPSAGGGAAILLLVRDSHERLADHVSVDLSFFFTLCAMPRCLTCGSANTWSMRIDRPARHAGLVEDVDPLGAALVLRVGVDLGVERLAVLPSATCALAIFRILQHRLGAERLAEALPDRAAGGGDVDVAVGGLEHAGRDRGRMIVAGLLGDLLGDQPARRLEVEHEDLRLQQRRLRRAGPSSTSRARAAP